MRYHYLRWIKITLTVLLMILAGILYSCSRQEAEGLFSGDPQSGVLLLGQDAADGDEAGESALAEGQSPLPAAEDLQADTETVGAEDGAIQSSSGPEGAGAGAEPDTCFVHICGAVTQPGVYELPEGSRIYQAVEMAGGFLPEADERYLNLASIVADGMQITIYTKEEAETAPQRAALSGTDGLAMSDTDRLSVAGTGSLSTTGPKDLASTSQTAGSADPSKIDINTADKEELMTLNGIGTSRADAIVAYRQEHGPFQRIEDIMLVPGIKDGAFQKIKDDITV